MKFWGKEEGDVVFNDYGGLRRYGIIEKKTLESNGWVYCEVKWHRDEKYEEIMAYRKKLTHKDWRLQKYRVDQLRRIDIDKELSILKEIKAAMDTRKEND
jgi:hypothetical protein